MAGWRRRTRGGTLSGTSCRAGSRDPNQATASWALCAWHRREVFPHRRLASQHVGVDVMELQPTALVAAPAVLAHERAAAAVALPDRTPDIGRDVTRPRSRASSSARRATRATVAERSHRASRGSSARSAWSSRGARDGRSGQDRIVFFSLTHWSPCARSGESRKTPESIGRRAIRTRDPRSDPLTRV